MSDKPPHPLHSSESQGGTNPLGGRVHTPRYGGSSRRQWSGHVAHIRRCPECGWENDEGARFCVSCAGDIRSIAAEPSSETRPGLALLQKRLERDRRQHNRKRGNDAPGGGGWIAVGAVLIAVALVVGPDRSLSLLVWIAAVAAALAGIWQIRRDQHAMRLWGGFLAATAALVLVFVGFRAIYASGTFADNDEPDINATPTSTVDSAATPANPGNRLSGNVTMSGGGPLHDSQMPGPAPTGSPILAWQVDTGGELYGAPAIADGILYVMSKAGILHALDAESGTEIWRHTVTSYVTRATPAVVDGTVYVGAGFTFSALDAATGAERWSIPLQYGGQASPTVRDGLVIVSSQQGWIFALEAESGEIAWRLPTEGIVFGAASITGDAVIYATDEGILYNVDRQTGVSNWRITLPGAIYAAPVVTGDTVLATTQAGELYALDLASGDRLWSVNYGGALPPATDGEVVVLAASDGGIYGLDAATGEQRWLYPAGKQSLTAPAITGNLAILGAGTSLLALDLNTGEAVWYFLAGDTIESAAIVTDGFVFFGSRDGFLNAISER
ncbi:MAG: PQQ-binding-like beta-propeller repeat protein [Chloroflexia bacterium]|nr:PQQ-binding-like beta-propeller repeat protein [Chloroflexia bacterium]